MPTATTIDIVFMKAVSADLEAKSRSPRDFTVVGLVDGAWTQVLQQVGMVDWATGAQKTFAFDATKTATSYRIITQTVGNNTGSIQTTVNLSEVRFLEPSVSLTRIRSDLNALEARIAALEPS
jgi:hypothetical protein